MTIILPQTGEFTFMLSELNFIFQKQLRSTGYKNSAAVIMMTCELTFEII